MKVQQKLEKDTLLTIWGSPRFDLGDIHGPLEDFKVDEWELVDSDGVAWGPEHFDYELFIHHADVVEKAEQGNLDYSALADALGGYGHD